MTVSSASNTLSLYILNLLSNAGTHPFPFDPLLRLLEPSRASLDIHHDVKEVFHKEDRKSVV